MNRKILLLSLCSMFLLSVTAHGQRNKKNKKKDDVASFEMVNTLDTVSYSLGVLVANNLVMGGFDTLSYDAYLEGLKDIFNKIDPKIDQSTANQLVNEYVMGKVKEEGKGNLEEANAFLAENAKKEGVITTSSGLQYIVVAEGEGDSPTLADKVLAHYKLYFMDGTLFQSSYDRGQPIEFGVTGVIPAWTEALQLMKPGGKLKLFVPPALGYGETPPPGGIKPNALLIFEMELVSIVK